jgi:DNA-directed RNA polymerase sigma subunit (sigma70/sigma32)
VNKEIDMIGYNENFMRECLELGISERNLMICLDRIRGVTLKAIAEDEGVSSTRISQIECKVLRTMRNMSKIS